MHEGTGKSAAAERFVHPDPAVDEALDWLVRLEAGGEVDEATHVQFDIWLRTASSHQKAWDEVSCLWADPEMLVAAQQLETHLSQQPVPLEAARQKSRARRPFFSYALAAAACVLVTVASSHLAMQILPRLFADYTTVAGERREISLPDGSRMILNTDSAVALDFSGNERGVRLIEGEAWFDVVHDAAHPFHVTAGYSEVHVKGTAFSVQSADGRDTILLQRGAIDAVHERKDIPVAHLTPGEMVIASQQNLSAVGRFDPENSFVWLDGRIVFQDQPLGKALAEMGRYFNGRVFVLNRALLDVVVSGDYRTDRAKTAIESLAAAAGGKTTIIPGGYIIIR